VERDRVQIVTAPRIVEWFRIDPWPRIRVVLLTGPAVLTLGGLVIAVSFLTRASLHTRIEAAVVGFVLVAGGALATMIGMQRVLRDEVSLALRTDGLVLQSGKSETFVAWDDVEDARWDEAHGLLVLSRAGGPEVTVARRFAGIDGKALADRIRMTKRKAAMNLLR
jgi:hypothetical protein